MEYKTNEEKMLQAVLFDEKLMEYGEYTPDEFSSIYKAMSSDNCIVATVAKIIHKSQCNYNENEIYEEISDYLKKKL